MEGIKRVLLFRIPMTICNLRCHFCYLSQREGFHAGIQPEMQYTPEQVGYALRKERVDGIAYANFCADGETLLVKHIDEYVRAVVAQGHYAEVVTNLTVTPVLEKFLAWDRELLGRVEFKCSFHYLELHKRGWLERFAQNVKRIWAAGASANIEITPTDELIPYIEEVKRFSMEHFGALPHLSIARDDRTAGIEYLTKLPMEEYDKTWSQFDSDFWKYKKSIFKKKQTVFCYAGAWSLYIDLTTGRALPCYCGPGMGDVFADPSKPLPERPVGKCPIAHCYNGHALLTLGLIPNATSVGYGDIRDRTGIDGSAWLQPELKAFFNTKLMDQNRQLNPLQQHAVYVRDAAAALRTAPKRAVKKVARMLKRKK